MWVAAANDLANAPRVVEFIITFLGVMQAVINGAVIPEVVVEIASIIIPRA